MSEQSFVSDATRKRIRALVVPVALFFGRIGLTPNALTVIGFAGTCVGAAAAAGQLWLPAGILVFAFGVFDLFDGALARATNKVTKFGAFLDSTLDRTGENLVYAGIAVGAAQADFVLGTGLAALAMAFASVVTYTRARAEAVGFHGEVGIAPRPERLVALSLGLALAGVLEPATGRAALALALGLIVVTSAITVVQRIVHVQRQARSRPGTSTPEEE